MFEKLKITLKRRLRERLRREVILILRDFLNQNNVVEGFEHVHFERDTLVSLVGVAQFGKGCTVGRFSRILVDQGGTLIVGDNSWINNNCSIETGEGKIIIGARTTLQSYCRVLGDVCIGDDVLMAPNCFMSSGKHMYDYAPKLKIREQDRKYCEDHGNYSNPIKIGNDCWLGINSVILPGVTIGEGSVVGANTVVSKDVEPYTVVGGVPAKFIKSRI